MSVDKTSRILAVDDDPLNVDVLVELLEDDFDLLTATSGEEALEIAERTRPDLILMDIMMPGIDGYEACRRIRASDTIRGTKVILVSAKAMPSERLVGYEAGADDYVTKPFDTDELVAKVHVFLRLKSAEELNGLKSHLLDLVSHELRTPLTGILPAAMFLSEDREMPTDERLTWAKVVMENVDRLTDWTEKGMLLCRLKDTGLTCCDLTGVNLRLIVQDVLAELSGGFEEKKIVVDRKIAETVTVHGSEKLVAQTMSLLLGYVTRMAPHGGRLEVEVAEGDGTVSFAIRVHGVDLKDVEVGSFFTIATPVLEGGQVVGGTLDPVLARAIVEAHCGKLELVVENGSVAFAGSFPVSEGALAE